MKRFTTDNPKGNLERLMNFAYAKDGKAYLSYADGKYDVDLCEYVSKLAKEKGFDFSPEFVMEDGLFDNYDDDFAVLYYCAVQAASLREALKVYENEADELEKRKQEKWKIRRAPRKSRNARSKAEVKSKRLNNEIKY